MKWEPIETAPKDKPILAWCESDCKDPECAHSSNAEENSRNLCLYHGHAEGVGSAGDGYAVVEWGGAWDDRSYEEPNGGWMPDWWFRYESGFEEAANPTLWALLPEPPQEQAEGQLTRNNFPWEVGMKKQTAINTFMWAMVVPLICLIGWSLIILLYTAVERTMLNQSIEADRAKMMYYDTQRGE